jgi:hypothetical protein
MIVKREKITKRFFFVYSFITLVPLLVNLIWVISLNEYRSEFTWLPVLLSNIEIFFIFACLLVGYFFIFLLYLFFDSKRVVLSQNLFFYFDKSRISSFLFLVIVANLFFYFITGVGRAGSWERNPISFLFNLFNLDFLVLIFFCLYRKDSGFKFWFIIILYFIFQISKGWTSFFLTFALLEFSYRSDKRGFGKLLFLVPFGFFIAALFYQFLYPFKNYIRFGFFEAISYLEALIKLFERFSFFSHTLVGYQNSDLIVSLYNGYGYQHTEIIGFFRSVVPSFLFKNKDFRGMGNLIMQSVYPAITPTTTSNMGFFSYFYNLIKISFVDFCLYLCMFSVLTFLYKIVIDMVIPEKTKSKSVLSTSVIFLIYFIRLFGSGSLEGLHYGWFSIIWTYVFLFLVKIIRIERIK